MDWADRQLRATLLARHVADADRLSKFSRLTQGEVVEDNAEHDGIVVAVSPLAGCCFRILG